MATRNRQIEIYRFEFDVEWPPGHVACYLIDGPEPILVDAGAPDRTDTLQPALSAHGYSPADIEHVLITHPHVDHIGNVLTVLEAGDPTVYAPSGSRERLQQDSELLQTRVRRNCLAAGFSEERTEAATQKAVRSLERNAELLPPDRVDVWLEPNRTETIGGLEIHPIFLPGHQADHLSYRTEHDGDHVLFAGDMGIRPFRPILIHDGLDDGYRDAFDAFYTSIDRMEARDIDRVYPGHGPAHGALDEVIERDRNSLDDRLDRVVALVSNGYDTAPEIASELTGGHSIDYILPETMSALAYLDAAGRVESQRIDGVRHYEP